MDEADTSHDALSARSGARRARVLALGALATVLVLAAAGLGLAMLGNVTNGQRWVTHTIEVQLQAARRWIR
jgi:hypothetical protein